MWAKASFQFILSTLKPLRHAESMWGWWGLIMMWLIALGILTTAGVGIIFESNRWLVTIITPILVVFLFFCAGVRLQYRLLRKFYISYSTFHNQIISFAANQKAIIVELIISNQQSRPCGISKWRLIVKFIDDGHIKEIEPIILDNESDFKFLYGKKNLMDSQYLQTRQPLAGYLCFPYTTQLTEQIENSSIKLLIYDDTGAYHIVPINEDTMVEMAKKSTARSEKYQVE